MAGQATGFSPEAIEAAATAIVKRRFYDCEPDMYASLDDFFDTIDEDLVDDARHEAHAALSAATAVDLRPR